MNHHALASTIVFVIAAQALGQNHEIYRNQGQFQVGPNSFNLPVYEGGINVFRDNFNEVDSIVAETGEGSLQFPLSQNTSNPRLFEWRTTLVASIEELDGLLPHGTYDLLLTDTDLNEFTAVLEDPGPRFTNLPVFTNFLEFASYDPTQPFTVEWVPMSGGNSLALQIFGPDGFYYVDRPGIDATSTVIPAGLLEADQRYVFSLVFADVAFIQSDGFDGDSVGQVFYQNFTNAEFVTVPTPSAAGLLALAGLAAARRRR